MKLFVFYLFLLIITVYGDNDDVDLGDDCSRKQNCDDCVRTTSCVWCSTPDPKRNVSSRCADGTNIATDWCSDIVNITSRINITDNRELKGAKNVSEGDVVQLKPQRVDLQLRVGEIRELPITYQQAEDYQVDLYYLMDLSHSTTVDYKDMLSNLGYNISEKMKTLTQNFKFGFGTFTDKFVMPFTSTVPGKLMDSCKSKYGECHPPYGFKNNMALTDKKDDFKKINHIRRVATDNAGAPKGMLDAIMQVMSCAREIGWRGRATRLLVVSTYSEFHFAGDGKLAGLVEPNDMKCHLDDSGEYSYHNITDYPSIHQVNKTAKEKGIHLIFVTPENLSGIFEQLAARIKDAIHCNLSKNSEVVNLVETQFKTLVSGVQMKIHNAINHENIRISFYSNCSGTETQTDYCADLTNRPKVEFRMRLQVLNCPRSKEEWKQKIVIGPDSTETLTIDLEMICECECSRKHHETYEVRSTNCSENGDLICGMCQCDDKHVGDMCQCEGKNPKLLTDTNFCENDKTGAICSGKGRCECNKCICDEPVKAGNTSKFYGDTCQCDDEKCPPGKNGTICSGPEHGKCICNKCNCTEEWSGIVCDCSEKKDNCKKPDDNKECSGRGNCTCNKCDCDSGPNNKHRYSGKYCENCPWCPEAKCEELKDCMECLVDSDCADKTCGEKIKIIQEKPDENEFKNHQECLIKDKNDCYVQLYYWEKDDIANVWPNPDRSCNANIWAWIFGVIGFTLLVGLIGIVIWKVLTTMHDNREYQKFERERVQSKWGDNVNPLYRSSTTSYKNPAFSKDAK